VLFGVRFRPKAEVIGTKCKGLLVDAIRYVPVVLGALGWLVGGNIVLYRVAKREGLRWPAFPPLGKLSRGELLLLAAFLVAALGGFLLTSALTEP
jgi:hypothetical protein